MKTAMIELRDKLLEVYDKEKESSIDNEYLKGYIDCLKSIATDIDAQMNQIEIDKNIEFACWLATNFVPTSSCGKVIYWQQKNYQGKEKFTTDKVYNIYVSEATKIAQKNEFVIPAVRRSFKFDYKFGHLSKEGYRHFPIIYFAYGTNGFSLCLLGATITVKLW